MRDLYNQFLFYAGGVWRRRWWMALVAVLTCAVGWTAVAFLPNTYLATGKIYVDTQSILRPLLTGIAVDQDIGRELQVMRQTLLSRPNLERLARETDLDIEAGTPAEQESLVKRLERSIAISSDRANIFTIEFEDNNPVRAKESVQKLIDYFVEQQLGSSRTDMDAAQRFIDEQIAYYGRQLETAEHRLADFKQKNLGLLPGSGGFNDRLDRAQERLDQAKKALRDATIGRKVLSEQLDAIPAMIEMNGGAAAGFGPPTGDEFALDELESRRGELNEKLDQLLLRYTENHPDVVALQAQIARLEAEEAATRTKLQEADQAPSSGSATSFPFPNPTHSQIQLMLAEKEAEIATLQEEVARQEKVVEGIGSKAFAVPAIEAELSKLNRDYGVLKAKYEELLSRRESAKISREREASGEKIQFRIIEPPVTPVYPSGPNRPLFLTAVLVFGLASGIAVALGLTLLENTFVSIRQLQDEIDLPLLGSVMEVADPRKRYATVLDYSLLSTVGAALMIFYGASMFVEQTVGLDRIVSTVRETGSLQPAVRLTLGNLSESAGGGGR